MIYKNLSHILPHLTHLLSFVNRLLILKVNDYSENKLTKTKCFSINNLSKIKLQTSHQHQQFSIETSVFTLWWSLYSSFNGGNWRTPLPLSFSLLSWFWETPFLGHFIGKGMFFIKKKNRAKNRKCTLWEFAIKSSL